jgi:hypothetical protein
MRCYDYEYEIIDPNLLASKPSCLTRVCVKVRSAQTKKSSSLLVLPQHSQL